MISRDSKLASKREIAFGIFLLVFGIYALSSPGRIDIVDGEMRFDVAYNWLMHGKPIVADNWIGPFVSVPGPDGFRYSYYGPAGSVLAMPLVWLGLHLSSSPILASQFLFSLTSTILAAAVAPLLFLFYRDLGVGTRAAVVWTMVSSFATLLWPAATSSFDNGQHAFFALAALYLAYLAAARQSRALAVWGGVSAGILFLYHEYLLLLAPALALATLAPVSVILLDRKGIGSFLRSAILGRQEAGDSRARYMFFLVGACTGVLLSFVYNFFRFGSFFENGQARYIAQSTHPVLGNPLAGLLTILFSPGKGILFYSAPVVLGIVGMIGLWRRKPELAGAILVSWLLLIGFISVLSFAGGDWCWGPRYLVPLLPLWALAFPFAEGLDRRRGLVIAIVAVGFGVQLLALSVENQRFFFERGLVDYFWAEDPWFYFKHSALLARVGEVLSFRHGLPPTARLFNPIPMPNLTTYCLLGPPPNVPRSLAPEWMRHFQIFYLPRPWPLWMSSLPAAMRPISVGAWLAGLACSVLAGLGMLLRGLRVSDPV